MRKTHIMKRIFTLVFSTILLLMVAQPQAQAQNVGVDFYYTTFYSPEQGPYVETYTSVVGNSVKWLKNENGKYQGAINLTIIFEKNGKVADYSTIRLNSPEREDTSSIDFNFLDQQRFSLPIGDYTLKLSLADAAFPDTKSEYEESFSIHYNKKDVAISGIELIESHSKTTEPNILSKSGIDLVPKIFGFYGAQDSLLTYYAEVYNTNEKVGENAKYLLKAYIQTYETAKKLDKYHIMKRMDAKPVSVVFNHFDISELASGNYYLILEARDQKNELIGLNSIFFQRSKPGQKLDFEAYLAEGVENAFVQEFKNQDTLVYYVHSIWPIASNAEKDFIAYQAKNTDLKTLQRFFYHFWTERDYTNPQKAWNEYKIQLRDADKLFATTGHPGFATDMGRVYLKYGPPNTITDRPFDAGNSDMNLNPVQGNVTEGGNVPYQIWHYYQLGNQRDKKFVFYNPHLAGTSYELLHSDAQGEINNPQWQTMLQRNTFETPTNFGGDRYGGKSGEYYNNPY